MEKEKVTLELPKAIVKWFNWLAEPYHKSVEKYLTGLLLEDFVSIMDNQSLEIRHRLFEVGVIEALEESSQHIPKYWKKES